MSPHNIVLLESNDKVTPISVFDGDNTANVINIDDTIGTIKKKILKYWTEAQDKCIEELYLFAEDVPLGILLPQGVPTNPYHFKEYNGQSISTQRENMLLLDYVTNKTDTIYLCFYEDINKHHSNGVSLYFPSVPSIDDLSELRNNRGTYLNEAFDKEIEYIEMFKSIGRKKNAFLKDLKHGIRGLDVTYIPDTQVNVPLDDVFNLLHATKKFPIIQLNARGRDKQYRLYAPNIAINGEQIPYIKKEGINKFKKNFTENNRVSFYIVGEDKNDCVCEFINKNGSISFRFFVEEFVESNTTQQTSAYVAEHMNNLIQQINGHVEPSGRSIELFDTLENRTSVKIKNIRYSVEFDLFNKSIEFNKSVGVCISDVFHVNNNNILIFKRKSIILDAIVDSISVVTSIKRKGHIMF